MIRWAEFLKMLADDGVTYEETHLEVLTSDGYRATSQFVARWVDGVPLSKPVEIESMSDPVPRWMIRQIATQLRLPPEKYIFPETMR